MKQLQKEIKTSDRIRSYYVQIIYDENSVWLYKNDYRVRVSQVFDTFEIELERVGNDKNFYISELSRESVMQMLPYIS